MRYDLSYKQCSHRKMCIQKLDVVLQRDFRRFLTPELKMTCMQKLNEFLQPNPRGCQAPEVSPSLIRHHTQNEIYPTCYKILEDLLNKAMLFLNFQDIPLFWKLSVSDPDRQYVRRVLRPFLPSGKKATEEKKD